MFLPRQQCCVMPERSLWGEAVSVPKLTWAGIAFKATSWQTRAPGPSESQSDLICFTLRIKTLATLNKLKPYFGFPYSDSGAFSYYITLHFNSSIHWSSSKHSANFIKRKQLWKEKIKKNPVSHICEASNSSKWKLTAPGPSLENEGLS